MSFTLKPLSAPDAPDAPNAGAAPGPDAEPGAPDLSALNVPDPFKGLTPGWKAERPEDFDPRAVELALEVLGQCRVTLMMAYRFLDTALWRMPFEPAPILKPLGSDGITLWFNPILVLQRFRQDSNELVRDMLHTIIHCILRHPYDATHENARAWWLACDMATEAMAMEMGGEAFPSPLDERRRAELANFRVVTDVLTPERIYRPLDVPVRWMDAEDSPQSGDAIRKLESLFARDSHAHWPQLSEDGQGLGEDGEQENPNTQDDPDASEGSRPQTPSSEDDGTQGNRPTDEPGETPRPNDSPEDEQADSPSGTAPADDTPETSDSAQPSTGEQDGTAAGLPHPPESDTDPTPLFELSEEQAQAEQDWEDISLRIQEDLETFSRQQGRNAGSLLANVAISNRKPVDYADFLRRFATLREDMKVNDDEFDYIYYTYGLQMYGNMPLVEPLEYQETHRVRDFVIAIDTSGSCSGELVGHFIDRTFQILRESNEFAGDVNIHLIQCDAAIREDTKITSIDELHRFRDRFQVKGMGGTDFRPVFSYVDDLLEKDEFDQLGGLIYFTDGYGTFPKRPPDYPTAFVFLEDRGDPRMVPPWAMKVVLRDDELKII